MHAVLISEYGHHSQRARSLGHGSISWRSATSVTIHSNTPSVQMPPVKSLGALLADVFFPTQIPVPAPFPSQITYLIDSNPHVERTWSRAYWYSPHIFSGETLAAWIKSLFPNKRLIYLYIVDGHGDYSLGISTLVKRFPQYSDCYNSRCPSTYGRANIGSRPRVLEYLLSRNSDQFSIVSASISIRV